MMEALADAYLRATRAVRAAPTHVKRFMLEALAEDAVVSDLLRRNVRESAARVVPSDAELTAIDAAVLRALVAETVVEFRWAVHIGRTDQQLAQRGPEDRDRAIACWAAGAIVRRRVEVRALEAEPSAETLADWLEVFSKALGLALARAEMVRVPAPIIGGMLDLFGEGTTERATRSPSDAAKVLEHQRGEMVLDRTFRTFATGDLQHWRLTPPVGHQFALAIDMPFAHGTSPKHGRGVRSVLTGQILRAYTATWALTDAWTTEHGGMNPHGLFEMRVRDVLYDLYGCKRRPAGRQKEYDRPGTTAEKELREAFATLHLCLLEGIGNVSASAPEPLLQRYQNDSTGRTVYRQAPLAMLALQKHFIQVPREVLRLVSLDTPLALGVARGLLQHARIIRRGPGHWRCTLEELARVAGDPIADARRNRGVRAAYRDLAEKLQRVVRAGALGEVHLEGEGPDALVTLTPSDALGTVYDSLAEPRPAEPLEAAVAKALTGKRRTGRPRKGPLA
jgi:hypothetical protein